MGSFPHEFSGYRHVSDPAVRASFEREWQVALDPEPGLRIPNMFEAALDGSFRGLYLQGDLAQPISTPSTSGRARPWSAGHAGLFLNETAVCARVPPGFVPRMTVPSNAGDASRACAVCRRHWPLR